MDIFGNLNEFLNNDDTPVTISNYDSTNNTPNSSIVNGDLGSAGKSSADDGEVIDISQEMQLDVVVAPRRRGRKRPAANSTTVIEELDLTSDLASPSKSRRRIVDELKDAIIEAEIDLSNLSAPEEDPTPSQKRGRRGRPKAKAKVTPKAKKPRNVSYKKALAVANTQIPELNKSPGPSQVSISSSASSIHSNPPIAPTVSASSDDFAIDLTGEVRLKSYHTNAPLFQKTPNERSTRSNTKQQAKKRSLVSQELEFDVEAITLHIKINGTMEKFQINPDNRFYEILKAISDRHNVQVSNVLLFNEREKRIQPEETPNGIGHKISSIYTCRVMDESKNKVKKENNIELKFQSDKWKKPLVIKASRLDSFTTWIKALCEKDEVKFNPEQISLEFDGDYINKNESPLELEFEGGEILDCRIKA